MPPRGRPRQSVPKHKATGDATSERQGALTQSPPASISPSTASVALSPMQSPTLSSAGVGHGEPALALPGAAATGSTPEPALSATASPLSPGAGPQGSQRRRRRRPGAAALAPMTAAQEEQEEERRAGPMRSSILASPTSVLAATGGANDGESAPLPLPSSSSLAVQTPLEREELALAHAIAGPTAVATPSSPPSQLPTSTMGSATVGASNTAHTHTARTAGTGGAHKEEEGLAKVEMVGDGAEPATPAVFALWKDGGEEGDGTVKADDADRGDDSSVGGVGSRTPSGSALAPGDAAKTMARSTHHASSGGGRRLASNSSEGTKEEVARPGQFSLAVLWVAFRDSWRRQSRVNAVLAVTYHAMHVLVLLLLIFCPMLLRSTMFSSSTLARPLLQAQGLVRATGGSGKSQPDDVITTLPPTVSVTVESIWAIHDTVFFYRPGEAAEAAPISASFTKLHGGRAEAAGDKGDKDRDGAAPATTETAAKENTDADVQDDEKGRGKLDGHSFVAKAAHGGEANKLVGAPPPIATTEYRLKNRHKAVSGRTTIGKIVEAWEASPLYSSPLALALYYYLYLVGSLLLLLVATEGRLTGHYSLLRLLAAGGELLWFIHHGNHSFTIFLWTVALSLWPVGDAPAADRPFLAGGTPYATVDRATGDLRFRWYVRAPGGKSSGMHGTAFLEAEIDLQRYLFSHAGALKWAGMAASMTFLAVILACVLRDGQRVLEALMGIRLLAEPEGFLCCPLCGERIEPSQAVVPWSSDPSGTQRRRQQRKAMKEAARQSRRRSSGQAAERRGLLHRGLAYLRSWVLRRRSLSSHTEGYEPIPTSRTARRRRHASTRARQSSDLTLLEDSPRGTTVPGQSSPAAREMAAAGASVCSLESDMAFYEDDAALSPLLQAQLSPSAPRHAEGPAPLPVESEALSPNATAAAASGSSSRSSTSPARARKHHHQRSSKHLSSSGMERSSTESPRMLTGSSRSAADSAGSRSPSAASSASSRTTTSSSSSSSSTASSSTSEDDDDVESSQEDENEGGIVKVIVAPPVVSAASGGGAAAAHLADPRPLKHWTRPGAAHAGAHPRISRQGSAAGGPLANSPHHHAHAHQGLVSSFQRRRTARARAQRFRDDKRMEELQYLFHTTRHVHHRCPKLFLDASLLLQGEEEEEEEEEDEAAEHEDELSERTEEDDYSEGSTTSTFASPQTTESPIGSPMGGASHAPAEYQSPLSGAPRRRRNSGRGSGAVSPALRRGSSGVEGGSPGPRGKGSPKRRPRLQQKSTHSPFDDSRGAGARHESDGHAHRGVMRSMSPRRRSEGKTGASAFASALPADHKHADGHTRSPLSGKTSSPHAQHPGSDQGSSPAAVAGLTHEEQQRALNAMLINYSFAGSAGAYGAVFDRLYPDGTPMPEPAMGVMRGTLTIGDGEGDSADGGGTHVSGNATTLERLQIGVATEGHYVSRAVYDPFKDGEDEFRPGNAFTSYEKASWYSRMTYNWLNPLVNFAMLEPTLLRHDRFLPSLPEYLTSLEYTAAPARLLWINRRSWFASQVTKPGAIIPTEEALDVAEELVLQLADMRQSSSSENADGAGEEEEEESRSSGNQTAVILGKKPLTHARFRAQRPRREMEERVLLAVTWPLRRIGTAIFYKVFIGSSQTIARTHQRLMQALLKDRLAAAAAQGELGYSEQLETTFALAEMASSEHSTERGSVGSVLPIHMRRQLALSDVSIFSIFLEHRCGRRFVYSAGTLMLLQDLLMFSIVPIVAKLIEDITPLRRGVSSSLPSANTAAAAATRQQLAGSGQGLTVDMYAGVRHSALLVLVLVLQSVCHHGYWSQVSESAMEAKTAVRTLVLDKVMALPLAQRTFSDDEVIELVRTEALRIGTSLVVLHHAWSNPLCLFMAVAMLWYYVGWMPAALVLLEVAVLVPLMRHSTVAVRQSHREMPSASQRHGLLMEALASMRTVKAMLMDSAYARAIRRLRDREADSKKTVTKAMVRSLTVAEGGMILLVVSFFSATYAMVRTEKGGLRLSRDAETVFPAVAVVPCIVVLTLMWTPITEFPSLFHAVARGYLSMKRVEAFLRQSPDEFVGTWVDLTAAPDFLRGFGRGAVLCHRCSFTWQHDLTQEVPQPQLINVTMSIIPGELVVVQGSVGAGKSTLLLAILGEINQCVDLEDRGDDASPFLQHFDSASSDSLEVEEEEEVEVADEADAANGSARQAPYAEESLPGAARSSRGGTSERGHSPGSQPTGAHTDSTPLLRSAGRNASGAGGGAAAHYGAVDCASSGHGSRDTDCEATSPSSVPSTATGRAAPRAIASAVGLLTRVGLRRANASSALPVTAVGTQRGGGARTSLRHRTSRSGLGGSRHSSAANTDSRASSSPHRGHSTHNSPLTEDGEAGEHSSHGSSTPEEERRTEGFLVFGSIVYCSEEPWLQSDTIQANITVGGNPSQTRWYEHVVHACALDEDFRKLPLGDQTVIGEKGTSLTMSQRARIALARAVFTKSDIYLLDSVLRYLDAKTKAHIIREVFHRLLRNKTVIMATNAELSALQPHRVFTLTEEGLVREDTHLYKEVPLDEEAGSGNRQEVPNDGVAAADGEGTAGHLRSSLADAGEPTDALASSTREAKPPKKVTIADFKDEEHRVERRIARGPVLTAAFAKGADIEGYIGHRLPTLYAEELEEPVELIDGSDSDRSDGERDADRTSMDGADRGGRGDGASGSDGNDEDDDDDDGDGDGEDDGGYHRHRHRRGDASARDESDADGENAFMDEEDAAADDLFRESSADDDDDDDDDDGRDDDSLSLSSFSVSSSTSCSSSSSYGSRHGRSTEHESGKGEAGEDADAAMAGSGRRQGHGRTRRHQHNHHHHHRRSGRHHKEHAHKGGASKKKGRRNQRSSRSTKQSKKKQRKNARAKKSRRSSQASPSSNSPVASPPPASPPGTHRSPRPGAAEPASSKVEQTMGAAAIHVPTHTGAELAHAGPAAAATDPHEHRGSDRTSLSVSPASSSSGHRAHSHAGERRPSTGSASSERTDHVEDSNEHHRRSRSASSDSSSRPHRHTHSRTRRLSTHHHHHHHSRARGDRAHRHGSAAIHRSRIPDTAESLRLFIQFMGKQAWWLAGACFLQQAVRLGVDVWVGVWLSQPGWLPGFVQNAGFLEILAALSLIAIALVPVRGFFFYHSVVTSLHLLYQLAVNKVFRVSVNFFAEKGKTAATVLRILTKDVEVAEHSLPETIDIILSAIMQLLAVAVFNSVINPLFLLVLPTAIALFCELAQRYIVMTRELRRLETRSLSGTIAILKESLDGAPMVRCFALQERIREEYCRTIDISNTANMVAYTTERWVGLRLYLISIVLVSVMAFFGVLFASSRTWMAPGITGVALVLCLRTSRILTALCRRTAQFHAEWASVRRLLALVRHIPTEPLTVRGDAQLRSYHAELVAGSARTRLIGSPPLPRTAGSWVAGDDQRSAPLLTVLATESNSSPVICTAGGAAAAASVQTSATGTTVPAVTAAAAPEPAAPLPLTIAQPPFLSPKPALEFVGSRGGRRARRRGSAALPGLSRMSLTVNAGERVGIVGHAGQGKSLIFDALLRLLDPPRGRSPKGMIYINGVDADTVPFPILRGLFATVPQSPLVLSGTWRENLMIGYRRSSRVFFATPAGRGERQRSQEGRTSAKDADKGEEGEEEEEDDDVDTDGSDTVPAQSSEWGPAADGASYAASQQPSAVLTRNVTSGVAGEALSDTRAVEQLGNKSDDGHSRSGSSTDSTRVLKPTDEKSAQQRWRSRAPFTNAVGASSPHGAARTRHHRRRSAGTGVERRHRSRIAADRESSGIAALSRGSSVLPSTLVRRHSTVGAAEQRTEAPDDLDDELWRALRLTGLAYLCEMDGGLDAPITSGLGANDGAASLLSDFSSFAGAGLNNILNAAADAVVADMPSTQRQLLCLARAVLNRPPFILLEDAASPISGESPTDIIIRQLLEEELRDCTVLIIVHRLCTAQTLCSRVAVMQEGTIITSLDVAALKQRSGAGAPAAAQAAHAAAAAGEGKTRPTTTARESVPTTLQDLAAYIG